MQKRSAAAITLLHLMEGQGWGLLPFSSPQSLQPSYTPEKLPVYLLGH